jgi:hypothetical protein
VPRRRKLHYLVYFLISLGFTVGGALMIADG